ncbi:hypothetical protein AVEN_112865-1 [Araneus ventricosus]|uniref:Uncharacterized protein n=1 Tax=Araneus ventricosus TaxID=182803 RepID=A0A4Y2HUD5_ARAVE|nr:hypothetical protein AVEN_112865-1 [Araneus ventricosus]
MQLSFQELKEHGASNRRICKVQCVQLLDFCKSKELIERTSSQITGRLWIERFKPKRSQSLVVKIQKWANGSEGRFGEEKMQTNDFTHG